MKTLNLPYPRIGLVLQGGGALGSYQAGVLEGLDKRGIYPTWVAGISIGSLNCAVIAGNAPKDRVEKLKGVLGNHLPPSVSTSPVFDVC
jgi:NTE family protein